MSTPWKTVTAPADAKNLSDIISEEYAKGLQVRKEQNLPEYYETMSDKISSDPLKEAQNIGLDDHCYSDLIIAEMLQRQFDNEYDICRVTRKRNGNAKLSVSYGNSHTIPLPSTPILNNRDCDEGFEAVVAYDSEYFETEERKITYCSKQGQDTKDKATKHNIIINRKIACNLLDEPTRRILCKLINYGHLKSINGIISMGKKSVILHATAAVKGFDSSVSEEYAIKIFKTTPNMIKTSDNFIKYDSGFKKPREIAHMWAAREMNIMCQLYFENYPKLLLRSYFTIKLVNRHNKRTYLKDWPNSFPRLLEALYELYNMGRLMQSSMCANNILCWKNTSISEMQVLRPMYFLNSPRLRFRSEHVLMMTFIGQHKKAASRLKDVILTPEDWQSAYKQVIDAMHELYHKGRLIHGHLNANNILWWKRTCWFIDFSQAVQRDDPSGYKFLLRDCGKICNFFKKKGTQDMKSKEELFEWITGFEVAHFGRA